MNTGMCHAKPEPPTALPHRIWLHPVGKSTQEQNRSSREGQSRMIRGPSGGGPRQGAQTHHQEVLAVLELIVAQVQETQS